MSDPSLPLLLPDAIVAELGQSFRSPPLVVPPGRDQRKMAHSFLKLLDMQRGLVETWMHLGTRST